MNSTTDRIVGNGPYGTGRTRTYTYNTQNVRILYDTVSVITDKDFDLKEVFAQYKRIKIDNETLYLDLDSKPPYKIHTCKLYINNDSFSYYNYTFVKDSISNNTYDVQINPKSEITFDQVVLEEGDVNTLDLNTATIDDIIVHDKYLTGLTIFHLLTYIGIDITKLPYNYNDFDQMEEIDEIFKRRKNSSIIADMYKVYENYYNSDNETYKNRIRIKYPRLNGNSPYPVIVYFNKSKNMELHCLDNSFNNLADYVKKFMNLDELFEGIIEASKIKRYGTKSYDTIMTLCKDDEFKEYSYKYLDRVDVSLLSSLIPDLHLSKNRRDYFNTNPIIREKLLSNPDKSIRELLINYLRCIPKGFENDRDDFIGMTKTDLFSKLSGCAKGIYYTINSEDAILKDSFANTLKIISLFDNGYDKSSLLMVLANLYIKIIGSSSHFIVKHLVDIFHFMEYVFEEEDLQEFISYFISTFSEKDSNDSSAILESLYVSDLKRSDDIGYISMNLFKEIEKTRQYKRYKLEKSLKN